MVIKVIDLVYSAHGSVLHTLYQHQTDMSRVGKYLLGRIIIILPVIYKEILHRRFRSLFHKFRPAADARPCSIGQFTFGQFTTLVSSLVDIQNLIFVGRTLSKATQIGTHCVITEIDDRQMVEAYYLHCPNVEQ